MATTQSYHVFGPAQVWVGTGTGTGAARLLQYVGLTEDGVVCRHTKRFGEIRTDVAGPDMPADLQIFGETAIISADLSVWSKAILDLIEKLGTSSTVGTMPIMGELLATNSKAFRLAIVPPSGSGMLPRIYNTAVLRDTQEIKLGTKYAVKRLQFYSWPFLPAIEATAFNAPHADSAGSAVVTAAGSVLCIEGAIAAELFDAATIT